MANNDEDRTNWTIFLTAILAVVLVVFVVFQCRGESTGEVFAWSSDGVEKYYSKFSNFSAVWDKSISWDKTTIDGVDRINSIGLWSRVWPWRLSFAELEYDLDFSSRSDRAYINLGYQFKVNDNFGVDIWSGAIENKAWSCQVGAGTKLRFSLLYIFTVKNDLRFYIPISNIDKPEFQMANGIDISLLKWLTLAYTNEWVLRDMEASTVNRCLMKFNF